MSAPAPEDMVAVPRELLLKAADVLRSLSYITSLHADHSEDSGWMKAAGD